MSGQQSQSIQTLLEAEKEAAKIVQEARSYRTQKLKDARSQATKEVDDYKKKKDEDFKKLESTRANKTTDAQSKVDKETDAKLAEISKAYESHKDKVVKSLLDRVLLVKPELHRNLKKVSS